MWEKFEEKHLSLSKKDCQILKTVFILIALTLLSVNPIRFILFADFQIDFNTLSLGLACFSIAIAFHACVISIKSDEKMEAVSKSGIQDSLINLENVRRRYKDDMNSLRSKKYTENDEYIVTILEITEWATWLNYEYIKKALCFKKYLTKTDKENLLRYHKILLDNVIVNAYYLLNRHIEHLLLGCKILVEELGDINSFKNNEVTFEEKFNLINIKRDGKEDFLTYINRHLTELRNLGLDNDFKL